MSKLVQLNDLKGFNILDIKQFENNVPDRQDFDNKYLKIFYFILHEGMLSTIRKYLAHRNKQQKQQKYLTFLIVEINQKKYVNISTQYQNNSFEFIINNQFYLFSDIDFRKIEDNLDYFLINFNQFVQNEKYELLNLDISHSISLELTKQSFDNSFNSFNKGLFIYGLGGYVKMFVMHHFRSINKLACIDYNSRVTNEFQKKYGFKFGFLTPYSSFPLLKSVQHPIVIIAVYHSDHSSLAYEIFKINPNATIFIEKPPTVTLEDLDKLIELFNSKANLEIGFNRRFINFSKYVFEKLKNKRVIITCSIKEVVINHNHWYLWKNQGTRITTNVVHWLDLANWWVQSKPIEINVLGDPNDQETSCISVLYENGSILNITASDKGNSLRGVQEKIEIRFGNETIFIDDFISLTHIKENGIKITKRNLIRKKGHNSIYKKFLQIIKEKQKSDYSVCDLIKTSVLTYYASQMVIKNIRNMNIEKEVDIYMSKVIR